MKWYKSMCVGCWILLGVVMGTSSAWATTPFSVDAKSAVVVDATTNRIVADKGADTIRPIASITKLMTAMVVLDAQLPFEEKITITTEDVQTASLRKQTYSESLPVGTIITRENLLLLALMNSHNRAAAALGRTYPGGLATFVQQMNIKAAELGMRDTQFVEPTGLSAANISTARDLAVMVRAASQYPDIQRFSTHTHAVASYKYNDHVRDVSYSTTNRLLATPHWDINVQKTGYTNAAGRCVVMLTSIGDNPFIVVLLNASSSYNRAADAIRIKQWIETGIVPSSQRVRALNPYRVSVKHTKHKKIKHQKKKKR
jgi:serine-type D-Ala-D-Ala endopeptidase (penicillin-binding protein 7)